MTDDVPEDVQNVLKQKPECGLETSYSTSYTWVNGKSKSSKTVDYYMRCPNKPRELLSRKTTESSGAGQVEGPVDVFSGIFRRGKDDNETFGPMGSVFRHIDSIMGALGDEPRIVHRRPPVESGPDPWGTFESDAIANSVSKHPLEKHKWAGRPRSGPDGSGGAFV